MNAQTVHVLKPISMQSGHVEDAMLMVQKTSGPLSYKLVDFDFEAPVEMACATPMPPSMAEAPAPSFSGTSRLRQWFGLDNIERANNREAPEVPTPREKAMGWIKRLEHVEQRYRTEYDIPHDDFVIVLSGQGNIENFFVIPRLEGTRMGAIQVNHTAIEEIGGHLIGYYLMALPVMLLAYGEGGMFDYLDNHAHRQTKGCLNDLCEDDVRELGIKTKTGDICRECKKDFQDKNLDWSLIRQMRQGFELVRAIQLNLEDFLEGVALPPLTVGVKPRFESLGKTVPLSPKEMAVYVTFLEAGTEGIRLKDIWDRKGQLLDAYQRRYNRSNNEEIIRVVNRLADNTNASALNETISKITSKFTRVLGEERVGNYIIQGTSGEAYKIPLSRHLVNRAVHEPTS